MNYHVIQVGAHFRVHCGVIRPDPAHISRRVGQPVVILATFTNREDADEWLRKNVAPIFRTPTPRS